MYKQHISVEDSIVFPLATRMLSDGKKVAIAEEMACRRRLRLVTELSGTAQVELENYFDQSRKGCSPPPPSR
jgi:hypothetical protein